MPSERSQRTLPIQPPPTSNRLPVSWQCSEHRYTTSGLTSSGLSFSKAPGEQAFGHAGTTGGGNGVDEDVVLAAFNGQGAGQTIEAELGHAVVGLTEVAVDAGGGGGEDDAPEVLLLHLVPRSMSDLVGPFHMNLVDQIPVGVGHLGKTLVAQDAGVVHDDIHPAEVVHGALYDLVAIHHAVRVGNG